MVDNNGKDILDSPLLGAKIFSNEKRPFGKLVDLDVDFQVSSLYGLEFGLKYNNKNLFVGKWSTSVIVHDMWTKIKCTTSITGSGTQGVQSTTRITDLIWSESELIKNLKTATKNQGATGDLSVSITLDMYKVDVFTIGRVFGTIGVAMVGEPLTVGGERKMEPADPVTFNFPFGHPCYHVNVTQEPWTYGAPFKVDSTRNVLVADLSNALPRQKNGNPLDLGTLYFGVLVDKEIQAFGEPIPYTDPDGTMWKHSGVIEQSIEPSTLQNSELVVFTADYNITTEGNTYPVKEIFPSLQSSEMVPLLLLESEYFVRPMDYYMDRLEYSSGNERHSVKNTSNFTLLVTRFGQPVSNTQVTVISVCNEAEQPAPLPLNAVTPINSTKATDNKGHVTFTFAVNKTIPKSRGYECDPCGKNKCECKLGKPTLLGKQTDSKLIGKANYQLPIDGQVYNFYYCANEECISQVHNDPDSFLYKALISILAFSTVTYEEPYTWLDHVQPIFRQVHHLHYIMRSILNLNNFTEVTLPHNIELLKKAFSKPIYDPNYMPATRDLSETKKQMILRWLDNPKFSKGEDNNTNVTSVCETSSLPPKMRRPNVSYFSPPRCLLERIHFDINPEAHDAYFNRISKAHNLRSLIQDTENPPRPLFGYGLDSEIKNFKLLNYTPKCTVNKLRKQLQDAVLLEFTTLPIYLTSMYSILENCNTDAYQAIQEVVMQEMLHLVQVANILIAVGGEVIIDHPNYVPSYPSIGLPGGVLPGLYVSLQKFNLKHVYDTMMAIEVPEITCVATPHCHTESTLHTIDQFYKEISSCIDDLNGSIFDPETEKHQVKWPWPEQKNLGHVYIINDSESAQDGIRQIVEQGEGQNPLNPEDIATSCYGHFYRFEEIVCQNRLIKIDENHYAYAGDPIVYYPSGVYPMRENPSGDTIVPGTKCYTEAKAFHRTYRNLLRILQETFNGEPDKIQLAVELMEALQAHAKKCMWTPYGEGNTCGPVWDYEWE